MDGTSAGRGVLPSPRQAGDDQTDGDAEVPSETDRGHGALAWARRLASWPALALGGVLVVQAALSLTLVRADTAFQDEALYLWAGHREWAHWLHGAPVPPFPAYFSGAPVIYPPLGALADSAGGLAAARVLSLVFMLGATALLWAVTARLLNRRAAFFAAALFAVSGPALHLGAFATYDALSVFLVALAAWCALRGADRRDATGWMLAAGAALALANAAAYATALLDPVVIALAILAACPRPGGKTAIGRGAILFTVTATLLLAGTLLGGSAYLSGISQTTLLRAAATDSPVTVLAHAWTWIGVIAILAVAGTVIHAVRQRNAPATWLLAILTAAALAAPLEQASLHTLASLPKHVALGAWFAAIAAGYAADTFITAAGPRAVPLTTTALTTALAFPATLGATQAHTLATAWPDSASFTTILKPLTSGTTGRLLVEDPSIAEYYLPAGTKWQRWSSTRNIVTPAGTSTGTPTAGITGAGNPAAFARYIGQSYFSLIALNFADTTALDHQIRADIRDNPRYRIAQVIPYGHGTYIIYALRGENHT